MTESDYTQAVHKRLPEHVFAWKIRDDYQGGVPDAFYRRKDGLPGKILWIEYKYLKQLPARPDTYVKPDLSTLQKQWARMAEGAGEQVRVIVGFGSKGVVYDLPEALTGIPNQEFQNRLRSYQEIAAEIASLVG